MLLNLALILGAFFAFTAPLPWRAISLPTRLTNSESARKYLPATMPGGIAVFDFDGDSMPDIFLPNGGDLPAGTKSLPEQRNRLFRNLGGMRFEDVTTKAGLGGRDFAFGASVGDYNRDGRPDLLVSHLHGVTLYRNDGNGLFQDVTAQSKIDNRGRWAVGAVWFDYNGDGNVDLYIINYVQWNASAEAECRTAGRIDFCHPKYYEPQPGALFRNNGDGTFSDVSDASGIGAHPGKGMGAAVFDSNADGRPDLFVTNDKLPAFLFRNVDGKRFEETAFDAGIAVPADGKTVSGMGADAQDVNGDRRPELVYTALRDETFPFYTGSAAGFVDASATSRMGPGSRPFAGWGVAFADLDNDGLLDIAAATSDALSGKVDSSRMGPVVWFRNAGNGRFEPAQPLTTPAMHRGLVAADLDNDGCLDLVVTALDAPAKILRNPCANAKGSRAKRQWLGSSAVGYASSVWDASFSPSPPPPR
ncbi:MAG: FG-GAP-like repeat-containing protein [Bryobacteraceae bacterium]|nr:FG-GAP-like repeat-containing protein [Bryobacteraceae bacterium]